MIDNKVEIADLFLLDTSSSMYEQRKAYKSVVDEYFTSLRNDPNANHTLIRVDFDTTARVVAKGVSLRDYSFGEYNPTGTSTNLYDAIHTATDVADEWLRLEAERGRTYKVLFQIMSDGAHNVFPPRLQHSKKEAQARIAQKEGTGYWTMAYLGANQGAWAEAESVGIKSALNYTADAAGIAAAGATLSASTRHYTQSAREGKHISTKDFWDVPDLKTEPTDAEKTVLKKLAKKLRT